MSSFNRAIVLGYLGRDPEVKYTTSGTAVTQLSVATTRQWKKADGERQEETEWHRVVLYDRLAEIAGDYLRKGRQVFIEGRLRTRKWEDKDGVERHTTEIVAETMQLIGGREDGAPPTKEKAAPAKQRPAAPKSGTSFDDMEDDIPF